jgi:hypothetical protein
MHGEMGSWATGRRRAFKRIVGWSFAAQLVVLSAALAMMYNGREPEGLLGLATRAYGWPLFLLLGYADWRGWRGEGVIGFVILGMPILVIVVALGYSLAIASISVGVASWRAAAGGDGQPPSAERA